MRLKSFAKRLCLAIAAFAFAISCSTTTPNTPETSQTPQTGQLRVAMIANGPKDDGSWCQAGYEGLKLIEKEFNAEVSFTESVNDEDGEAYLREYAEAGYDFIIAHGGGYISGAEVVADEFPRTKFALVTTYGGNNRNLGAVAFRSGEAGYLAGVLAAMTTETNKVAYIVGYDYPVYQEEAALFRKGAIATNPDVEVATEFLQTWVDGEKATSVALNLSEQGFDRFALNADEAGIQAMQALVEGNPKVKVIGWTADQYELAPGHIITSVVQDIPQLVRNAADLFQQGKWEGKLYKFGFREGIYNTAPFRDSLSADQIAKFEEIRNKVAIGEIDISPE